MESGHLHFNITGEFLTGFARQLWIEGKCSKAINALTQGLQGMSDDFAFDIVLGKRQISGDTRIEPDLYLEDDNTTELYGISLDENNVIGIVRKQLKENYITKKAKIRAINSEDKFYYNIDAINACDKKEKDLIFEITFLCNRFKYVVSDILYDIEDEVEDYFNDEDDKDVIFDVVSYVKSITDPEEYPDLNYDFQHCLERVMHENPRQLFMYQEMGQIPHSFLQEYRSRQHYLDKKRGDDIVAEELHETEWLTGWLLPSGKFIGCPDITHTDLNNRLFRLKIPEKYGVNLSDASLEVEDSLEKAKWIKIAEGRVFYHTMPGARSKLNSAQSNALKLWMKKLNMNKIYINYGFVNIDEL